MAITWIKEFVSLAGTDMVPYGSGILSAVLPCLAYEDDNRKSNQERTNTLRLFTNIDNDINTLSDIRETGKAVNYSLMKLITNFNEHNVTPENRIGIKPETEDMVNNTAIHSDSSKPIAIDLTSVVDVLTRNLQNTAG